MGHIQKNKIKKYQNNPKARCDGCGRIMRTRHLIQFKGKILCRSCRNKLPTFRIQQSVMYYLNPPNSKNGK